MIGFGFWDGSNDEFESVNDNILNLLDFPMENLESDEFGEDLDEKFRSLGPIDCEDLQLLLSQSISNSNSSVQSEQTCHLNKDAELDEDSSGITCRKTWVPPEPPRSPISYFSSGGSSCSSENTTPNSGEKSDSLDLPFSATRNSTRTKKPIDKLKTVIKECQKAMIAKEKQTPLLTRKCLHCDSKRTPQWRHGPMGKKTLCNACGVAYSKGRLLPEYRPAASPTFVRDLYSNKHKKIVEMRQSDLDEEVVIEEVRASQPPSAEDTIASVQSSVALDVEQEVRIFEEVLEPSKGTKVHEMRSFPVHSVENRGLVRGNQRQQQETEERVRLIDGKNERMKKVVEFWKKKREDYEKRFEERFQEWSMQLDQLRRPVVTVVDSS